MKIKRRDIEFIVSDASEYTSFWSMPNWGWPEYSVIEWGAKKTDTFIDIGAWIGPMTLFASKIYDKVYSFEPDPIAFRELEITGDI